MATSERQKFRYNGYDFVADLYQGKFQGSATHAARGDIPMRFAAEGPDIESVVISLRKKVNDYINSSNADSSDSKSREIRHMAFVEQHGKQYLGVRESAGFRFHRVTHCYVCRTHLDNAIQTECIACGWILCNCGACGCGWSR